MIRAGEQGKEKVNEMNEESWSLLSDIFTVLTAGKENAIPFPFVKAIKK